MTRLTRYVAKKVKTTTKPKKKIKKTKMRIRKPVKITVKDIEREKQLSGYTGKITPYIKKQLVKKQKLGKNHEMGIYSTCIKT